jgi:sugar phosphate isomerase/epimerase
MKRKQFLQTSAALLAGSLMLPKQSFTADLFRKKIPDMGLQLFTFFNEIDNDVEGTLKKIAAVGYKNIESAFSRKGGFYGTTPKEFAAMLKNLGLSWKSHHVFGAPFKLPPNAKPPMDANGKPIAIPAMKNLKENMQELVDAAAEGSVKYLVCANIPITTLAEVNEAVGILNKTDEACKKAGMVFCYHNHHQEFLPVEGQKPYDIFLKQTTVKMELDIAWAIRGGVDVVELFKKHKGRFPLWHVKDLAANKETVMPLGEGTIDYKPIFKAAKFAGLQNYFIEHDMPKDALASITTSYAYINNVIKNKK